MLTHRITLPDGTEIEFFASGIETFQEQFGNLEPFAQMQTIDDVKRFQRLHQMPQGEHTATKHKANKAVKQARKHQKQARRKQR